MRPANVAASDQIAANTHAMSAATTAKNTMRLRAASTSDPEKRSEISRVLECGM
jgi:hypothetical protein